MIRVTVFCDSKEQYKGFEMKGHAGYAEAGSDIICAAVSALALNTANSIEKFTDDAIVGEESDGYLKVEFPNTVSKESKLLLDSMILGIQDIMESTDKRYVNIRFKEV